MRDQGSPRRRGRSHVEDLPVSSSKEETGSVVDRPRARVPKKLTNQHYVFLDQCLQNDDVHARAIASTRIARVLE